MWKHKIRDIQAVWVTQSQCISKRSCLLLEVVSTALTTADGLFRLYDGLNTKGEIFLTVRVSRFFTSRVTFTEPFYCKNGLYIELVSNMKGAMVKTVSYG